MRGDSERLEDILAAINQINDYIKDGKNNFENNKLIQSGVLYQLIIIGEAVGDLSLELKEKYSYIPWQKIIGMRNIIAHEYFQLDLIIIWSVLEEYLPELRNTIVTILSELNSSFPE